MKKYEKFIFLGTLICSLFYPFFWIIGFLIGFIGIVLKWKTSNTFLRYLFCFLIFLAIIKGIFSYLCYYYFFINPHQIDRWYLMIEKYPIELITPYEPNVYYEIIRQRSINSFKRLKKIEDLAKRNIKWQHSQEWLNTTDYFDGNKLKFIKQNGTLIFYSIGPDKIDDKALILYDPSNGIVSRGDITNNMSWKIVKENKL